MNREEDDKTVVSGEPTEVKSQSLAFSLAAEKVREFPQVPGVYLLKDHADGLFTWGKPPTCALALEATS